MHISGRDSLVDLKTWGERKIATFPRPYKMRSGRILQMMNALGAIDTKGNIVLEQFQDGTALLFQPGNAQPFCVATDYDRATASWSYGKYFSDLGCAHEAADPEIIADASVRWVKEDIREKLKAQDIAPTEFNVQSVIMGDSRLWERPLDREFRDNMIASGNDDLDARVTILKENGNFKNVDTAIPVTSLEELEQYRSDRLTDKVTSLKDSLDTEASTDSFPFRPQNDHLFRHMVPYSDTEHSISSQAVYHA